MQVIPAFLFQAPTAFNISSCPHYSCCSRCFCPFRHRLKAKKMCKHPPSAYTAGVYTSSITLNNQSVDIRVVVDKDRIKSASIVNLDESVAAMYPLLTTSMDAISPRNWPPASPSMISVTNRPAAILQRYFSVPSPGDRQSR